MKYNKCTLHSWIQIYMSSYFLFLFLPIETLAELMSLLICHFYLCYQWAQQSVYPPCYPNRTRGRVSKPIVSHQKRNCSFPESRVFTVEIGGSWQLHYCWYLQTKQRGSAKLEEKETKKQTQDDMQIAECRVLKNKITLGYVEDQKHTFHPSSLRWLQWLGSAGYADRLDSDCGVAEVVVCQHAWWASLDQGGQKGWTLPTKRSQINGPDHSSTILGLGHVPWESTHWVDLQQLCLYCIQ